MKTSLNSNNYLRYLRIAPSAIRPALVVSQSSRLHQLCEVGNYFLILKSLSDVKTGSVKHLDDLI